MSYFGLTFAYTVLAVECITFHRSINQFL